MIFFQLHSETSPPAQLILPTTLECNGINVTSSRLITGVSTGPKSIKYHTKHSNMADHRPDFEDRSQVKRQKMSQDSDSDSEDEYGGGVSLGLPLEKQVEVKQEVCKFLPSLWSVLAFEVFLST